MKRTTLETEIQRRIEAEIGAEPDVLLLRNSVGAARYATDDGKEFVVPYGLGKGSPDLVFILAPTGRMGGLEVKCPGEEPTEEQLKCHAQWRRFGAFVAVVRSPQDARAALEEVRRDR